MCCLSKLPPLRESLKLVVEHQKQLAMPQYGLEQPAVSDWQAEDRRSQTAVLLIAMC
jgi:hypothetical protein